MNILQNLHCHLHCHCHPMTLLSYSARRSMLKYCTSRMDGNMEFRPGKKVFRNGWHRLAIYSEMADMSMDLN